MAGSTAKRIPPLSPNIQIYRPQLTSVLSIVNRLTGIILSVSAVVLVGWLISAAAGAQPYAMVEAFVRSWVGQILLFGATFAFFLHLCGGLRHLIWDAGYGFELRTIYASGWAVVVTSAALTLITWIASVALSGQTQ
jgi:succinate dehydrogenase / fumarate reductase, cytochrome b subunit